jgi:hypothetical protein
VCTDCHVALVPDPPEGSRYEEVLAAEKTGSDFDASEYESLEPVCVYVATAIIQAEIVLSTLKAYEVRAFIAGTGMEQWSEAGGIGQITRAPGPLNQMRIMVHPDDEETAREIIRMADREMAADFNEPDEEALSRPRWRVDAEANRKTLRGVGIFMLLFLPSVGLAWVLLALIGAMWPG